MKGRYGAADRIWVLDRGLVSEGHIEWLKDARPPVHRRNAEKPGGGRFVVKTGPHFP